MPPKYFSEICQNFTRNFGTAHKITAINSSYHSVIGNGQREVKNVLLLDNIQFKIVTKLIIS